MYAPSSPSALRALNEDRDARLEAQAFADLREEDAALAAYEERVEWSPIAPVMDRMEREWVWMDRMDQSRDVNRRPHEW